jgi:hypothetical protein
MVSLILNEKDGIAAAGAHQLHHRLKAASIANMCVSYLNLYWPQVGEFVPANPRTIEDSYL